MIRVFACLCTLTAVLCCLSGVSPAADQAKAKNNKTKNNQMVTGTIKSVDVDKSVLIILQKVKNEKVDRELSITEDVEFEVGSSVVSGRKGMELIEKKIGANVKVKCDKDVNVLKVTVK